MCYGFPADRSTYAVKTFTVEVDDGSGGVGAGGESGGSVVPSADDKLKRANIDSTVELSCEFSSEDVTDLKWRKLDGVRFVFYFHSSLEFNCKIFFFFKRLSDYTRDYQGKLYIYYSKKEDSGEYECYLPDGRRSVVRLEVIDPNDQSISGGDSGSQGGGYKYAVRGSVENPSLKFKNGDSVEQTCSGLTNGDSLSIEWYGPNGRVSYF